MGHYLGTPPSESKCIAYSFGENYHSDLQQAETCTRPTIVNLDDLSLNVTLVTLSSWLLMPRRNPASVHEWVLLIHQLPPKPTNLRVRIWRKLQKLGAVAIKNSVYVLPATEKAHEDFQWLRQEIEAAAGEASVFKAAQSRGLQTRR